MSSTHELVINFEDPRVDVQIISDQLRQLLAEIFTGIQIISSNWHWYVSFLEYALCTRFRGKHICDVGVT